jgi:2-phospho-L-lactate/phosphoenolpyruvate guanylyltransferase
VDAHVLVPLKALGRAKSRLAAALSAEERAELMLSLLERVMGAIRDDRGLAWNDALAAAAEQVVRAPLMAVISADLPLLRADEVEELLEATPERGIAIARAFDGGTNAVSMRPPGLVRTRFGERASAAVHAGLGVDHVILDLPSLAFDLDTPEDLARMHATCL